MPQPFEFSHLSVIGVNFLEPAFDLINHLEGRKPSAPNDLQSSIVEHAYSSSIILLTVVALESSIRRLKYFAKDTTKNILEYAEKSYSDFSRLIDLVEVFALRDAIVHSHLWLTETEMTPPSIVIVTSRTLTPGFGDKRFASVLDPNTHRTRSLGLNLSPTSVSRNDVCIVLRFAVDFLTYLETKDPSKVSMTSRYYQLGQKHFTLGEAITAIESKWRTC
jgi:hypothetical protein